MPVGRIRLPLKITRLEESFSIVDAAGVVVSYVYFGVADQTQRFAAERMSRDEAEGIAKQIARALTDNQETANDRD